MALPKSKSQQASLDKALKLVGKLSPEERERLSQQLQLEELRYQIQKGIDAADRGELISAEEVFAGLKRQIAQRTLTSFRSSSKLNL